jgi:hypothetical protein
MYINLVDIKYVVCKPNDPYPPNQPVCSAPVLVATEYQPVSSLADLSDVRNNTYPVHVERTADNTSFVFWERCASFSNLPFGGTVYGDLTCPDADIVGAYSTNGGTTWSAPFGVDTTTGHQIMPWAVYDSAQNIISIAYENCNNTQRDACAAGIRQIPSGSTTPGAFTALSTAAYPEAEANRPYFEPLFGDYMGAAARGTASTPGSSHLWVGYTDTLRLGLYGFGTQSINESNNNAVAIGY